MDLKKYLQENKNDFEVVLIDKTPHLIHYQVRMVLESQQAHIELLKNKLKPSGRGQPELKHERSI